MHINACVYVEGPSRSLLEAIREHHLREMLKTFDLLQKQSKFTTKCVWGAALHTYRTHR